MKRKESKENQIEKGETSFDSSENEEERIALIKDLEDFNFDDLEKRLG